MKNGKTTFQLDLSGGLDVLTDYSYPVISNSTKAIADRAKTISGVGMSVNLQKAGVNRRGQRALGTITTQPKNEHEAYKALDALKKSIDAGRV